MNLVKNMWWLALAACCLAVSSAAIADEHHGRWVSHPRGLIVIVVGEDGGRISGPEWEYDFAARATVLDFEIVPGRRLVLRRAEGGWAGEYFHPRVGPGEHEKEPHSMLFVRDQRANR